MLESYQGVIAYIRAINRPSDGTPIARATSPATVNRGERRYTNDAVTDYLCVLYVPNHTVGTCISYLFYRHKDRERAVCDDSDVSWVFPRLHCVGLHLLDAD